MVLIWTWSRSDKSKRECKYKSYTEFSAFIWTDRQAERRTWINSAGDPDQDYIYFILSDETNIPFKTKKKSIKNV